MNIYAVQTFEIVRCLMFFIIHFINVLHLIFLNESLLLIKAAFI